MAVQQFGTNDSGTVKAWSRKVEREVLKKTLVGKLIGSSSDSVLQVRDELSKGPGDRIRIPLRMQLDGDGILGHGTALEGNEEDQTYYYDDLIIDQLRHATRWYGGISDQRVVFDQREEAKVGLSDWGADRLDKWFLNQVAGNAAQTDTRYTGLQAVTTIHATSDGDHYINAETPTSLSGGSNDQDLDSSGDLFVLPLLDEALNRAKTLTPAIRPIKINGGDYYIAILHPNQVYDLQTTSAGLWEKIQLAAMQGGSIKDNPYVNGALGIYKGVILWENSRIPGGFNSSTLAAVANTRRAVFLGAQAAWMGIGRANPGAERWSWKEKSFDYEDQHGISIRYVGGLKRSIFNSKSLASCVMSTYTTKA